jgi:hypothetical protein
MKTIVLFTFFVLTIFIHAQVGIGTNIPSNNAVLDVSSTNKGLMMPRISDTTSVPNPTAGLLIYNNKKAPTFHNGVAWQTLNRLESVDPNADCIVYSIGSANGFIAGTHRLENIATGGSQNEDKLVANLTIPIHANTL